MSCARLSSIRVFRECISDGFPSISDYRLVPWLSLLYLLSFLDRSNIGNANLFGLSKHLKLTQNEYSACLAGTRSFGRALAVLDTC